MKPTISFFNSRQKGLKERFGKCARGQVKQLRIGKFRLRVHNIL